MDRIEQIRIEAGRRMGMGEVAGSVVPKFAVIAPPRGAGALAARYFMPWATHPSMAVSGAIALGTVAIVPGSVAEGVARLPTQERGRLGIEHPMGTIEVVLDARLTETALRVRTAGALRTARLIMRGEVLLPDGVP